MSRDRQALVDSLMQGIQGAYPSPEAVSSHLADEKPLRVYLGFDPTSPSLHLGHVVPLRILRILQDLGHHTTMLLGDFTATVGDPSGRDSQRKVLSREDVESNARSIRDQLGKVLDLTKTEIRFNSEWYDDPSRVGSLRNFLAVAHHFTAAQLWERDMFQVRQEKQQPVSVTEFMYPILQAYDAVELKVDLELGGNDQMFNMLAGRTLAKQIDGTEKFVLTVPLLLGTDGRKMSKSFGNVIALTAEPNDMYGQLMAINDTEITPYFQLILGRFLDSTSELDAMKPRDAKALLAREIVAQFHGLTAATAAEEAFIAQFRDHKVPADLPSIVLADAPKSGADLLVQIGAVASKSEAQRLIEQGAVTIDDEPLKQFGDPVVFRVGEPRIVKVGKRKYYSVSLS